MFGGKKTPEEKQREKAQKKAELERKIAELNAKKGKKKSKSKGAAPSNFIKNEKAPDLHTEPLNQMMSQNRAETNNNEHVIEGVVTVRRPTRKRKSQLLSQQEFIKKHQNQVNQLQRYNEIVSRVDETTILQISQMLNKAEDIFKFYQTFMQTYNNDEILVALNILDKTDIELFRYIIRNKLIDEIYQGEIKLYNDTYVKEERNKFYDFKKRFPEFDNNKNVLEDYLPHVYLLGNDTDFKEVNMMSLPTEVTLLKNNSDISKFAKDDFYKVVLLFPSPFEPIITSYLEVKDSQDFPIFATFDLNSISTTQRILPFNRTNLIKKIALK